VKAVVTGIKSISASVFLTGAGSALGPVIFLIIANTVASISAISYAIWGCAFGVIFEEFGRLCAAILIAGLTTSRILVFVSGAFVGLIEYMLFAIRNESDFSNETIVFRVLAVFFHGIALLLMFIAFSQNYTFAKLLLLFLIIATMHYAINIWAWMHNYNLFELGEPALPAIMFQLIFLTGAFFALVVNYRRKGQSDA